MKKILLTGAFVLSSLMSLTAVAAAAPTPEEEALANITRRQAVFKLLSFANGPLGAMARTAPYDAAAAKTAVERVAMLASMIPEVTAADTSGPASAGIKTRASNTIWASKADFDQLAADLGAGAAAALEILNTQGEAGVKDAVAAIGPKCGACHDRFRMD